MAVLKRLGVEQLAAQQIGRCAMIELYVMALAGEAQRRGYDGVVCGHIHHAEMRDIGGILYVDDGDWVESCTALVEHEDGRLELLDRVAESQLSFFTSPVERTRARPAPVG